MKDALRERWGTSIFQADGCVNRKAIAQRVFGDSVELKWLESLVHPKVRQHWEAELAKAPESNWLVEIPLLFEKKLETRFDLVVCVASPPKAVDKRMLLRGYSPDETKVRRQRQMSLHEKVLRSDHVISNAGDFNFLKLQTQRLIQKIEQRNDHSPTARTVSYTHLTLPTTSRV